MRKHTAWRPSAGPRDWAEDFDHENGQYQCRCIDCGEGFVGHKRRPVCKLCATKATDAVISEICGIDLSPRDIEVEGERHTIHPHGTPNERKLATEILRLRAIRTPNAVVSHPTGEDHAR